ncbi:MAG: aminotransferase class V-fold PLP-dependent enzyme [Chthoniobacterales bacterium]|jgi:cysteine desulfurase|nr:aminotransferase class V-fold PLP-dependent enzyme [Chthoniobacterales bacterium]
MSELLYLDHNATTPIDAEVLAAMLPWLENEFGNPSSLYSLGRRSAAALTKAREQVASLVGAQPSEIIFNSCGTEATNTAILSALAIDPDKRHIITSAVEHSATIKLCEYLATRGYEITWLPVDKDGILDPEKLESAITADTAVVSLLWANNETGVLFPIDEIVSITTRRKVPLHLDAVQAAGKVPINLEELGVQYASLSAHKLYAPKGVGALYVNRRARYTPLFRGSQEESKRGGTQNVASIIAFGKAAELAQAHLLMAAERIGKLRDHFEQTLLSTVAGIRRNGTDEPRLPNTSNLTFAGIEAETALLLFDKEGLCCSAGSACSSGSINPSHVLTAMGVSRDEARASLRFSLGRTTTDTEIDRALEIIPRVIAKLRAAQPASGSPVHITD